MANYPNPSFICFAIDLKERNGTGSLHFVTRLEDMKPTDEQVLAARRITERAADELAKVLDL